MEWWKPWELLRPFFSQAGYELYNAVFGGEMSRPRTGDPPALDSFGLHGDRTCFSSFFPPVYPNVFAARDRQNRDVVIKLISKGEEGQSEKDILLFLNSEPLRSEPANATVRVIEWLDFQDYCFAVFPFCDGCDELPFLGASECLDFIEQVLEVSTAKLTSIAQDVSHENILVNHRGSLPPIAFFPPDGPPRAISPLSEWRSTFPVRYLFIDFGRSVRFDRNIPLSECTAQPSPEGRLHRAPETLGPKPYNPFAADVYQAARLFYAWFPDLADGNPDLLKLLQDMSCHDPSRRISVALALARLRILRPNILNDRCERTLHSFPSIPEDSHTLPSTYLSMGTSL
ncbi:hypothetical protein CVT26_004788 [Gymnopilus dilepis]|uniref:Protein kinase domain-containing protein n=1 Tax=Gymnopilus dilepis TaxID=231916 RepID=A0A409XZL6_9AGAR|nr:hypothetical protein CVT26_004788 [Gymnopilus dilepis]